MKLTKHIFKQTNNFTSYLLESVSPLAHSTDELIMPLSNWPLNEHSLLAGVIDKLVGLGKVGGGVAKLGLGGIIGLMATVAEIYTLQNFI